MLTISLIAFPARSFEQVDYSTLALEFRVQNILMTYSTLLIDPDPFDLTKSPCFDPANLSGLTGRAGDAQAQGAGHTP
jgi:hypothetical protein